MTTEGYRNKPNFKSNATINKDMTINVPEFNSNTMDNSGMAPLTSCGCGGNCGCGGHGHKHDHDNHECCCGKHKDNKK